MAARSSRRVIDDARVGGGRNVKTPSPKADPVGIAPDPHRSFVFPNRMRELRRRAGFAKLLALSARLPDISYVRLSKIERGEVFARAVELERIAAVLGVAPDQLLIDVSDPAFDIAAWAEPFHDGAAIDADEERFALLLAAALRKRRSEDAHLTIAALDREYGLPPVMLSRIENAYKPFGRWNADTRRSLLRIFAAKDERALRRTVTGWYEQGALATYFPPLADPEARRRKSAARIAQLREELASGSGDRRPARAAAPEPVTPAPAGGGRIAVVPMVPVFGSPLPDGLIAPLPTQETVEAPRSAGPRAFGLRIGRPTLGAALPAHGIVVVDPDRFPSAGGLAALREGDNYRLLTITFDRHGAMRGHSVNPELEIAIDERDPADLAAVLSAIFA